MEKHTKGPWGVSHLSGELDCAIVAGEGADITCIAQVFLPVKKEDGMGKNNAEKIEKRKFIEWCEANSDWMTRPNMTIDDIVEQSGVSRRTVYRMTRT